MRINKQFIKPEIVNSSFLAKGPILWSKNESVDFAEVDNHPLTVTLTGTNFLLTPTIRLHNTALEGVQWVSNTLVTAQIPANSLPGFLLGIYDVWVVNPGGQANVLRNAVKIGKQTYLPTIANAP